MPRLLAFVPCEKVVSEQGSDAKSIINILEGLSVLIPHGAPPPPINSFIGMNWSIYALWEMNSAEENSSFQARSRLLSPSGAELFSGALWDWRFPVSGKHQTIEKIGGFPIWAPGRCSLVHLLKTPSDNDFIEVARISIVLSHETPQA
jgi:hypothetical protein